MKEVRRPYKIKTAKKAVGGENRVSDTRVSDGDIHKVLLEIKEQMDHQIREIEEINKKGLDVFSRVRSLEKDTDIALGRHRNVVIEGVPEPHKKEKRVREDDVRHHLTNILRMANIPGHVAIKRMHRLGKWHERSAVPRPIVVEFANPRHRDHFLSAADTVKRKTKEGIRIMPDDRPNMQVERITVNRPDKLSSPCLQIPRMNAREEKLQGVFRHVAQCSSTPKAGGQVEDCSIQRWETSKRCLTSTGVPKNVSLPQV